MTITILREGKRMSLKYLLAEESEEPFVMDMYGRKRDQKRIILGVNWVYTIN